MNSFFIMSQLQIFILISTLVCISCRKNEAEVYYEETELGQGGGEESSPSTSTPLPLTWEKPEKFTETAASQFSKGSYVLPSPAGDISLAITSFPGRVGGTLANINRWRQQLELEPLVETSAPPESQVIGEFSFIIVELDSGTGKSMLAAILEQKKETWFFKMMGPSAPLLAQKDTFTALLESVSFSTRTLDPSEESPGANTGMVSTESKRPSFALPSGWEEITSTNSMRLISLRPLGVMSNKAEIGVIAMSGVSSEASLLKMWSRTLQLPQGTVEKPPGEVTINGRVWKIFEEKSSSPVRPGGEYTRLIVVFSQNPGEKAWFIKGYGEDKFLVREKSKIISLVGSIQFPHAVAK